MKFIKTIFVVLTMLNLILSASNESSNYLKFYNSERTNWSII